MNYILETKDLKKYYGTEPNITKALDGISVAVGQGEFVSIIGTSGSGKSTLLNMLGGLDIPTSGSVKVDKPYVDKIIKMLHLTEKLDNLPNNLSGGQQQRVAIARALASKPAIILADEPTGNLDSKTSLEVMQLLRMTSTEFAQTLVMITHNPELAQIADRMIHIEDGKVTEG